MRSNRVVVIGGGLGGLSVALELNRRGYDVEILERRESIGGKACERHAGGFRWDEGPSIVVMVWIYRDLFEANGLDPDAHLPLRRLDPAFHVFLSDGRSLTIPTDEHAMAEAFATIDPHDGQNLIPFLRKLDTFAAMIGRSYCDRILESWSQVLLSKLMLSATVISPRETYTNFINGYFRSTAIRELFYGFPTYSGFDPAQAPASMAIVPWTILREGVWYPERGGIHAIPEAIARACRDRGVAIQTGVEVEAIDRDARGHVRGVETSSGHIEADLVVSNSDWFRTHQMLRGGPTLSVEAERLRNGDGEPSSSFFTIQLACNRTFEDMEHHVLVLTEGSHRVYQELFEEGRYPSDPSLYVNVPSITDPSDVPEGCCNPFVVVGAPPLKTPDEPVDRDFEARYAEQLVERLDVCYPGLKASVVERHVTGPAEWQSKFHAFRGAIYGPGTSHNILDRSFRPINYAPDVPGLYFVGGGVQPGPGMPMVVQSGRITAEKIARDRPIRRVRQAKPRTVSV